MDSLQFSVALQEIWKLIGECNKYIDVTQPWVLGREEAGKPRLRTVLYTLAECVRRVAALIGFVMPRTPARIYEQLGVRRCSPAWISRRSWSAIRPRMTRPRRKSSPPSSRKRKSMPNPNTPRRSKLTISLSASCRWPG